MRSITSKRKFRIITRGKKGSLFLRCGIHPILRLVPVLETRHLPGRSVPRGAVLSLHFVQARDDGATGKGWILRANSGRQRRLWYGVLRNYSERGDERSARMRGDGTAIYAPDFIALDMSGPGYEELRIHDKHIQYS